MVVSSLPQFARRSAVRRQGRIRRPHGESVLLLVQSPGPHRTRPGALAAAARSGPGQLVAMSLWRVRDGHGPQTAPVTSWSIAPLVVTSQLVACRPVRVTVVDQSRL